MKTIIITLSVFVGYLTWCYLFVHWMDKRASRQLAESFDKARDKL